MTASLNGHLEVLRLLLERGAPPDDAQAGTGGTAFHFACINQHPDCAEALWRAGCDIDAKCREGSTGLEIAEAQGHAAVVDRLRACPGPPGAFKRLSVA